MCGDQDVTNPILFQTMPVLNSAGTLNAYLAEDPTGSTTLVVRAVDDGSLYNDKGTNISATVIITLRLTTGNAEPAFNLAWLTRCAADGRISVAGNHSAVECSCSLSTSNPDCLLLHPNLRHVSSSLSLHVTPFPLNSSACLLPHRNSFISPHLGPIPEASRPISPHLPVKTSRLGSRQQGDWVSSDSPHFESVEGADAKHRSVVYGKQGLADIVLHNFATDITPAVGIRPSTDVTFAQVRQHPSGA
jgi:hypothetical protein